MKYYSQITALCLVSIFLIGCGANSTPSEQNTPNNDKNSNSSALKSH